MSEVHLVARSKGKKVLLDQDFVVETQTIDGRTLTQKQPEGTFSQPNGRMCLHMVTWATRVVRGSAGDCLELYCGNGNFTQAMAPHFRQIVATEVCCVPSRACPVPCRRAGGTAEDHGHRRSVVACLQCYCPKI